MRNLKVCISYNGSKYHGYQYQPHTNDTVQEQVQTAVYRLTGEKVTINGCSRTDAGVHANNYVFNVNISCNIPCGGFIKGMNGVLPGDIAVLSCEEADSEFHARFDAVKKEYIYVVNTAKVRNAFKHGLEYHYPYPLDDTLLNTAAKKFIGTHDFSAFCKKEGKNAVKSTVRTIYEFDIRRTNDTVTFRVCGNGFLYNMVRILVGTLIYFGEGKISGSDIDALLINGDRTMAGVTIPPCGLYLNKIFY